MSKWNKLNFFFHYYHCHFIIIIIVIIIITIIVIIVIIIVIIIIIIIAIIILPSFSPLVFLVWYFIPLVFVQTLYFYSFSGNNYRPLGIVIFCYYVFVIYNAIVKKAVFRIFSEAETAALHKLFNNKSLPFYSPCEKKNYNNRQYVDFFFLWCYAQHASW